MVNHWENGDFMGLNPDFLRPGEASGRVDAVLSVFTDHTLAHPLNCRGGVVARLSA